MDNTENIEKNYNSKISRKKLIIIVIISLLILGLIVGVYKIIMQNIKDMNGEKFYKQQVLECLEKAYNKEFEIKFISSGYKKKTWGPYTTVFDDKNIEEYLYSYYPKDNTNLICYVKLWYKIDTNTYELSEYKYTYLDCLKFYNEKLGIQDKLENYLGDEYIIDMFSDNKYIYAISNRTLEESARKDINKYTDLYNKIRDLIFDKHIDIKLKYQDDTSIYIDKSFKKSVEEILELVEEKAKGNDGQSPYYK